MSIPPESQPPAPADPTASGAGSGDNTPPPPNQTDGTATSQEEIISGQGTEAPGGSHPTPVRPAVRPGELNLAETETPSGTGAPVETGGGNISAPEDEAQAIHAAPPGFVPAGSPAVTGAGEDESTAPGHRPAPTPAAQGAEGDASTGISEATPTTASEAPAEDNTTAHTVGSVETMAGAAGEAEPQAPTAEPESRHPHEPPAASTPEGVVTGHDFEQAASSEEGDGSVYADFDKTWHRIEEAFAQKKSVNALVVDRVKGGLLVDIGVQGFVPASQVASGKIHDLEKFVGRTLTLRITDLDRERQRVVLSARQVLEEEHAKKKRETLDKLKPGWVTEGIVRRLTDFGAFVDIGGVDGLLHVTEMAWSRVKHPKEVVSPGDKIKVKVLKVSDDRKKISLGMRQLLPDPWNTIESQCKVGDIVTGRVVRVAQFGAFVQVRDGIEAILPNSEVSNRKPRPEELPQVGDTVQAKVIELRPDSRRMTLSTRRIQEDADRKEYQQHVQQSQSGRRTTIGDMFGDILSDWNRDKEEEGDASAAAPSGTEASGDEGPETPETEMTGDEA